MRSKKPSPVRGLGEVRDSVQWKKIKLRGGIRYIWEEAQVGNVLFRQKIELATSQNRFWRWACSVVSEKWKETVYRKNQHEVVHKILLLMLMLYIIWNTNLFFTNPGNVARCLVSLLPFNIVQVLANVSKQKKRNMNGINIRSWNSLLGDL